MSCPSWQWHRTGTPLVSSSNPTGGAALAPLWCDLEFFPNSRGSKAAANLRPIMPLYSRVIIAPPKMSDALNHQVWCRGCELVTVQDRNVTQSARPWLRESTVTGTPSQWLPESESVCQSTRAAAGKLANYKLTTGPRGLGSVLNLGVAAAAAAAGHRLRLANALLSMCGHHGPSAELEKLGPRTEPLLRIPSLVQRDVVVAYWSRQEPWRD